MAINNSRLKFHKKHGRRSFKVKDFQINEHFYGQFIGPSVVIKDSESAKRLYEIVSRYFKYVLILPYFLIVKNY